MRQNKISIIINKPINEVFEYTVNPKNTHKWIFSIKEEKTNNYPPKIGTKYKNTSDYASWDTYKVIEFKKNKIFALSNLEDVYNVRYTYNEIDDGKTEIEYFEWMKNGELKNPFTKDILYNLKSVIENQ